jgi:hypothetical protein
VGRIAFVNNAPSSAIPRRPEEAHFSFRICDESGVKQKNLAYSEAVDELRLLKKEGYDLRYDEPG